MNIIVKNSHADDISAGHIQRKKFYWKFGVGTVGSGDITTVWSGATADELYEYIDEASPGTPAKLYIKSSSTDDVATTGSGAWTVKVSGLDENYKSQEEVVELNGTTAVATVYEYLRVFRMSVETASTSSGAVGTITAGNSGATKKYAQIDVGANQTQMALFTVPAGHQIATHTAEVSAGGGKETNVYIYLRSPGDNKPFQMKQNWKIKDTTLIQNSVIPFFYDEKTDFEFRGMTETAPESVACTIIGHIDQVSSVPIDLTTFSATAGENSVTFAWDEQTPSETADMDYFLITATDAYGRIYEEKVRDKDATGGTITGLEPDKEYEFTAAWIGFDGKSSTVEEATGTPALLDPSALSASTTSSAITLSWTDNTVVCDEIEIWRSPTSSSAGFVKIYSADLGDESYVDGDVVADHTYYYKIRGKYQQNFYTDYTSVLTATAADGVNMLVGSLDTAGGTTPVDSAFVYSTDQGATWTIESALADFVMADVDVFDGKIVAIFDDPSAVADSQMGVFDGTTWTYDATGDISYIISAEDYFLRIKDTVVESTTDLSTWTTVTGASILAATDLEAACKSGTDYYVSANGIQTSTDGLAWAQTANQPTVSDRVLCLGTSLVAVGGLADTTLTWETTADGGATAWASGTSTITATSLGSLGAVVYDGAVWGFGTEDDYSASYLEYGDGSTFTSVTVPGSLPISYIATDGINLYITQADLVNDDIYISINAGAGFGTPILVQDGAGTLVQYVRSLAGL